ncbi:hypothetical protein BDR07DRAFT_1416963 [Suillus spraguei]|nr:hypothetical protein BDR07DRAFT_1416963 [Suillus spraguei]
MVPSLLLFFPITRLFLPMLRSLYSTVPASLLLFFSQPPSLLLFHSHTRRHWFSLQHRHCVTAACRLPRPAVVTASLLRVASHDLQSSLLSKGNRPCSQWKRVLNHTKWPKYTISSIPSLFLTLVPSCFCRSSCRFCGS